MIFCIANVLSPEQLNWVNSQIIKRSLSQKIQQASMNNDYMMTVLNSFCQA